MKRTKAELYRERLNSNKKRVIVFGSGPIRIGQGIEFDYCSVHCVRTLKKLGYEAIIANNNPETVSTDFDTSDRLYFDPLTPEDVDSVLETEQPEAVVVQFGGQTADQADQASGRKRGRPYPGHSGRQHRRGRGPGALRRATGAVRHPPSAGFHGVHHRGGRQGRQPASAIRCCSVRPMCWAART